jgi:glycogen debranching enzyme
LHQGWKDSSDAVFHADGSPASEPIALCEVQGYAYAAKIAGARLAYVMGKPARAIELERSAAELKTRFNEKFWCPAIRSYAIALDGDKRQCAVRNSNAGHALYTGIASDEYAYPLAETLLADNSFNGWGIRTIAASERRYNPMSYHNGSVWPHDNALIAAGLSRYGFPSMATRIMSGLFEASVIMDLHRLPELFCGFPRMSGHAPTLYPVACSPQAWSAGSVFMLLQACLGLSFSPEKPQLRFQHPTLPEYLDWLEIRDLHVGSASVDLKLMRYSLDVGIDVTRKQGDVEIAVFL